MWLIAGLGNPGDKYAHTRHNMGFDTLDMIIEEHHIPQAGNGRKFSGMYGKGMIGSEKVIALKPMTYMNESGRSIAPLAKYYGVDVNTHLIVIYDDLDLEAGDIRIRAKGSAGGHNGMKSIISCLGTQEFIRIRVGVGKRPENFDQINYVLSRPRGEEEKLVRQGQEAAAKAVELIVEGKFDEAMNRFNKKKKPSGEMKK
ncbi:MAG: aminoacyl-tRNA hydrolase [Eubacterium sp.]|nr:aminoacyl-tRNA hydrolase [Eubacterium sp.]